MIVKEHKHNHIGKSVAEYMAKYMANKTMADGITPYRTAEIIVAPKPTYGLLKVKKLKPHVCKTPWALLHFFHWLTFSPIQKGDLWRCKKCDAVHVYSGDYGMWHIPHPNQADSIWESAGGVK